MTRSRLQIRDVTRLAREAGVDMFVDLNFDKNIWLIPKIINDIPFRKHVLHHATQYRFDRRSIANTCRTAAARNYLRRIVDRGSEIVVHTPLAADVLESVVSRNSIRRLGYPIIESQTDRQETTTTPGDGVLVILFVGRARREKGLRDLIDAASRLTSPIVVQVVGPQDPETVRNLERQSAVNIEWINRYVSDTELAQYYRRSSLVAVPYRNSFRAHGGASGVLLQALAHAKPVITTEAVSDQLPLGYGGAVVVPAENVSALAAGIEYAQEGLAALCAAAVAEGPPFIRDHHTFEAYVTALLERNTM